MSIESGLPGGQGERLRSAEWRRWVLLALFAAAVWWLWDTPLFYPLRVLVVVFHELSHAAAGIATGGRVVNIEVTPREGGVCRIVGGDPFVSLSAGYLGSLVVGGVILVVAARGRRDGALATVLGVVLVAAALLWMRPLVSFGFAFTLAAGLALAASGFLLPPRAVDLLLRTIGLTSVLYAVLDIRDDILARPGVQESDAAQLARLTGLPTLFWGLLWISLGVAAAALFLRLAVGAGGTGRR